MNSFLSLLYPAPHLPEIKDKERVKQEYKYWRIRIFYSMFIGYAFYYFTRKSFTFAMPGLIKDLEFDKTQLGILSSILSISYGISKFASGFIGDRTNPRYMMGIGLMLTGVWNICFGLSSSILFFAIFWGLNGWFQGFGWPPCARFLTQWYSQKERGSWWSTWNVSHNVGGFLIPWVAGVALQYFGWRYAMYIPGVLCILIGFFLINRLRDTPQSLGLPPIEKYRNDFAVVSDEEKESGKQLSTKQILIQYILKNPFIWLLAIAYFFVYLVRGAVNDWTALFLIEAKGYAEISANGCASLFEVGGFFGSLVAGWSSDKIFGAKRGPINVLFTLGTFLAVGAFWLLPIQSVFFDSSLIFLIGFMIFGPQMMIGMAAAELSHKNAAATSTGFVGFFAYLGSSCAGYPLGYITQYWGWQGLYLVLIACCAIPTLLLIPLWSVTTKTIRERAKPSNFAQANTQTNTPVSTAKV